MHAAATLPQALFVGLISGTSVDSIDAVLARFEPTTAILAKRAHPWPQALRERVLALARQQARVPLYELTELDGQVADTMAAACQALLVKAGVRPEQVRAIGSHGQTIGHFPQATPPGSLQIGNPARIAETTGIDVVADFRAADLAAGGQGAPLLPVLHQALLACDDETRVVLNLGGIANLTVLAPGQPVTGFDTGPANGLMDAWCHRHLGHAFDHDGSWAARGRVHAGLLQQGLEDEYFQRAPPKSTGREHFNLDWLDTRLPPGIAAEDVQATLLALTVTSVVEAIHRHAPQATRVLACGGGAHNRLLMAALQRVLEPIRLETTAAHGIDPDFLEATAFAWLARQHLLGLPGNLPSVTGARGARVLGACYPAPKLDGRQPGSGPG